GGVGDRVGEGLADDQRAHLDVGREAAAGAGGENRTGVRLEDRPGRGGGGGGEADPGGDHQCVQSREAPAPGGDPGGEGRRLLARPLEPRMQRGGLLGHGGEDQQGSGQRGGHGGGGGEG